MIVFTTIGIIIVAVLGRFFFPSLLITVSAILLLQYFTNFISLANALDLRVQVACVLLMFCFLGAILLDTLRFENLKDEKIKYYE